MIEANPSNLLERYQRLMEIATDLASTLDLDALLNRIVHVAADLSNAEAASILLYDEKNQQLYFEATSNLDEPLMRGLIVPVDSSIAGWIVIHCQPVIIADTQNDPRHFSSIAKATNVTTTSMLGIPLTTKGQVVGVLEAINKIDGLFTEEDQHILMALGAQAAVAIVNARLFQQSDLISEMVHELRTPLASLNAATYLLTHSEVTPEKREKMVKVIQGETNRLTEMTTAFLDLARLESGRMQFFYEVFDVNELIQECVIVVSSKVSEQGLHLHTDYPEDIPALRADRNKMKQVILNLISNAIKYNRPDGSVFLTTRSIPDHLVIEVEDTGPGISQEDQNHLFEKFFRVKASAGSTPGTGLGLAICKRIVESHAGRIEVQSEVGTGTTFQVILPLKGNEALP